jgi:hypothetical protein
MDGVIWGGVDLNTTYGFVISRNGFDPGMVEARASWVLIPDRDGEKYVKLERGKRTGMILRGYITQSSFGTLETKVYGMDSEFLKVCSVHPDANYAALTFALKDLYIPGLARYYPRCVCVSFRYEYKQAMQLATVAHFEIGFEQEIPQMIVGTSP